ncbi:MAG: 50S ribosomal protein L30 [Anaerovoracaceae bacterium]|jgi:large subunit ribosomal protein L30
MAGKVRITLTRSTIGATPKQKKIVAAMGLKKMHQSVEMQDNEVTAGAVQKVSHLVTCEKL